MVSVYTQYRKHYRGPSWDDFAVSEYNRKRDYCLGRRSVEHEHQPWVWDSSDSENSDFETKRDANAQKKQTVTLAHGELANERKVRNEKLPVKGLNEMDKPVVKQAWATEHDSNSEQRKQKATQTTHRRLRKCKRKKAAKSKTEVHVPSLVNDREGQHERVPFVAYGWANNAPIEKKYTHNVRADAKDVYPASLRALKRRELDIQTKLAENKKKALLEREIMKEKFFNLSDVSPVFMTEYQSSFCNMGGKKTGYVW